MRLANSQWIVSLDCPAPDHHWQHGRNFYWELLSATGAARPMGIGRGMMGVCVFMRRMCDEGGGGYKDWSLGYGGSLT